MITSYFSHNTKAELQALLTDAETRSSNNSQLVGMDELMVRMQDLETKTMQFKKQGGDPWILRRVSERLEALSSQLVTR
ncbi:MAG: hypothetical protein WCP01_17305 [Methylococcaceae bacterium]